MTYKNMKKIDEILYNIDCLILDRNKYFEDLVFINDEYGYDRHKKELVVEFEDKKNMVGTLKKMIIDMIDNEKFWETMFEELDKTSQEDWEQFVKEHDKKYKKKKLKK